MWRRAIAWTVVSILLGLYMQCQLADTSNDHPDRDPLKRSRAALAECEKLKGHVTSADLETRCEILRAQVEELERQARP